MRSSRSLTPSPCLTRRAASMEWVRMASCSSCRSPPRLAQSIMIFSVAMKGSSRRRSRSMTAVLTTRPSTTLTTSDRMASTAKKPSATLMRLLALSSSVRSNHWVEAVMAGLSASATT